MKRKTHGQYVTELADISSDIIPLEMYCGTNTKIRHRHSCGYEWNVIPKTLLTGHGCPKCGNSLKKSDKQYKQELKVKHITCLSEYINSHTKLPHVCDICEFIWHSKPYNIVSNGRGCPQCVGKVRKNTNYYKNELILKNIQITCIGEYSGALTKTLHRCNKCHRDWDIRPNDVLSGYGCPKCSLSRYSKISIRWLDSFNNPDIQHAENGGEYPIPTTRWRVDGYDQNTNTIYEFLGDCWHGNLNRYKESHRPHPWSDKTTKELHEETMTRINELEAMNYNIIYVWETDYRNGINISNMENI